jgi:hypothetical protein
MVPREPEPDGVQMPPFRNPQKPKDDGSPTEPDPQGATP